MNSNEKITYNGSRIEVEGHGISSTMPDQVTLTFVCNIGSISEENIFTQLKKASDIFGDALEKWSVKGDSGEIVTYTVGKDSAKDPLSAIFEVQVTTSRLDEIPDLIRLGEKYGAHVNYNLTEFGFTREKQQEVEDDAVEQAIIGTRMAIHSLSKATGVTASRVLNIKVTNVIHQLTDYTVDTLCEKQGGMIMKMRKATTTADVLVTYLVEE